MSFSPKSPPSVKSVSTTSSKYSNSPQKKKNALPPAPASVSFSQRFQSVLFSLYNPQDRDKLIYGPLPPVIGSADQSPKSSSNSKKQPKEELPEFDSPLCAYKIKTDLDEDQKTRENHLKAFHNRSAELVNELSLKEYDQIKVSMVPFDVERTAEDRSVTEKQHQLDERLREIQDSRSQVSYRSRDLTKKKRLEEDQASFSLRKENLKKSQKNMAEEKNNYSSPSLSKSRIQKEDQEKKVKDKKSIISTK